MKLYLSALIGGIVSFLSPCIIPIIPMYFGFLSGDLEGNNKKKLYLNSIIFLLGFTIANILLSIIFNYVFNFTNLRLLTKLSGILIIFLGIFQMGIINFSFLMTERKFRPKLKVGRSISAFLLGFLFTLGWTPCTSPVLVPILIIAGQGQIFKSIIALTIYSIGFSIPFFLSSLLMGYFSKFVTSNSKAFKIIRFISGILIVLIGILMFTGKLNVFFSI